MTGNDSARNSLTSKQRKALAAVLTEPTVAKAALTTGVAEVTLFRWLREPDFRTALREAEDEVIDAAMRRLLQVQDVAITTMIATMTDAEASHAVRLRAAVHALDFTLKLHSYRRQVQREDAASSGPEDDLWIQAMANVWENSDSES